VADANEKLSVSEAKNEVDMKLKAVFKEGEALLTQQFNSYSFGIDLNSTDQKHIMEDVYNRFLQQKLIDLNLNFDILSNELESTRKMTKQFKQNQEVSNKKINEIQLRYESVKEEMQQKVIDGDKRLN
jgi:hypothetical protein